MTSESASPPRRSARRDDGRAVVITGIGLIAGTLCGVEPLRQSLLRGHMPLRAIDRDAGYHFPESSRFAVLAGGVDLSQWITPIAGRRMSAPSKFAVAAAKMALADAALTDTAGPGTAIVVSNALGAVDHTEKLLRTAMLEGPEAVSPFAFAESVSNAPAAQVAIACQARGPNITVVQREAGILTAVGRGAAEIAAGRADTALVGGVEELPPIMHAMFDRLDALARPGHEGGEVARPFDRRRSGFVAAEGAVILVLESEERAKARQAPVRARVRGFGSAFDPTSPRIGWGTGHASLAQGLRRMIDRAGLHPADIGRVVSGASGAIAGDRLDALTLSAAFHDAAMPPVLAPKGVTGQYGGGFLGAAVLAVTEMEFGPTAGFDEPDPALGITPHGGGPLPGANYTLVTSLASGGTASWLILEKP
jgi:3-oxoacyl-[acyl-carrier-protein] synthase II